VYWFPARAAYLQAHADSFPINGQYVNAISMLLAIVVYIGVSLVTCRQPFNLMKMLHRGQWAVDAAGNPAPRPPAPPRTWKALVGIDEHFTPGDKMLALALFIWSMSWFAVFVVVTVWNLIRIWPDSWWVNYWFYAGIALPIVLGAVTSVWFTIGGVIDLRQLFRSLGEMHPNPADDGEIDVPQGKPAIPSTPALAADP
jgi:SSS family solute:Na+ symporter